MTATTALIIVDVQKDFCPGGTLAVSGGDKVVAPINTMITHARKNDWPIFITLDWHPKETKHFKEFGGPWPTHCVQGTRGAEPHSDLDIDLEEMIIIAKGVSKKDNGYSGFEGLTNGGKSLLEMLSRLGVSEVLICGLATDYCVKATVLDALKHDFVTHVLVDACRAVNIHPDDGANALVEMARMGAFLTNVDEVCA